MNTDPVTHSTAANQEAVTATPGSLEAVRLRITDALVANTKPAPGQEKTSESERARNEERCSRFLWQIGMIDSLRAREFSNAIAEETSLDEAAAARVHERELGITALEAATRLQVWTDEMLGDPSTGEDPENVAYQGYAEDLHRKLIDEASRAPQ